MQRKLTYTTIQFDLRDWENGYFITVRIPYSQRNLDGVLLLRNSACITLIK